jgi:hypothetical protein
MSTTWMIDINDFLDDYGDVADLPLATRRLFAHITAIIVMATNPDADAPPEYQVQCRRRPNRKRCSGMIQTDLDPDTGDIIWWCPVCNDTGVISNWQDSLWDMTDAGIEH